MIKTRIIILNTPIDQLTNFSIRKAPCITIRKTIAPTIRLGVLELNQLTVIDQEFEIILKVALASNIDSKYKEIFGQGEVG